MREILDALEFCKENKLYSKHINIALGINQVPLTVKQGLTQLRMSRNERSKFTIKP